MHFKRFLGINSDFSKEGGWTNIGKTYPDILGKGRSILLGIIILIIVNLKLRK